MGHDTASPVAGRRQLLGGAALVAMALGLGQVLAYAQTLVAARSLSPADFGAFSALLALLLIGNTVALAVQAVTARHIVASGPDGRRDETAAAWRATLAASSATALFWLLLTPVIGYVLRVDSTLALIALALTFFPLTIMGGALGIVQGHEAHGRLATVYVAVATPRAVVTIAALLAVGTLVASIVGMFVGSAVGSLLCWLLIRSLYRGGQVYHSTILRELPAATYSLLALFTVTNLDIILARAFLPDTDAGTYAVGVIVAKIATWLPQFVAVMAYARMVDERRHRTTLVGLGVVAGISALVVAVVWLAPDLILAIIAGPGYEAAAEVLPLFALIGSFAAILQFVVYGLMAVRDRSLTPWLWAGCAVLALLVWRWHPSVLAVVLAMTAVMGTLAAIGVWRLLAERQSALPALPALPENVG